MTKITKFTEAEGGLAFLSEQLYYQGPPEVFGS